ncbi:MAG: flagellar motor switch protein FliN [Pseudomonadota bacterium]
MSDDPAPEAGESMQLEDMEEDAQAGGADAAASADAAEDDKVATDLESVFEVPVNVSAVLGKTRIPVASLLKLNKGAIVELDRKVGEAIDIYVNNRLVARGEVVVVEERLGVTMTEIVKNDQVN